jgi:hypothetical protein
MCLRRVSDLGRENSDFLDRSSVDYASVLYTVSEPIRAAVRGQHLLSLAGDGLGLGKGGRRV